MGNKWRLIIVISLSVLIVIALAIRVLFWRDLLDLIEMFR